MGHRMYIVGTSKTSLSSYASESLRLYRLDNRAVKDIPYTDLEPVAERLDIGNFTDFQSAGIRSLYPQFYRGAVPRVLSGADACFVLGSVDGGYVTLRPHVGTDFIRVIPRSRLVSDVKKGRLRLLNAVIEQINGTDIVAPFADAWEDVSYLTGRALSANSSGVDSDDGTLSPDKRDKIAAGEGVNAHDELGMLSPAQKEFLKDYYIEYSVEAFNRIAGTTVWKLKGSKVEKLAKLRELSGGGNWRFAGMWDGGFIGADKCEMGHKLRYVYMACPVDKSFAQAKQEGTLLKFGIVCHSDFLEIPREDAARLGKLQDTLCDEIAFISMAIANGDEAKHKVLMSSMFDLLSRLSVNNLLVSIIGERLAKAFTGFVSNNIPLVESFVLDVQERLESYGALQVLSAAKIDTSDFHQAPAPLYELPLYPDSPSPREKKNYEQQVRIKHQEGLSNINRAHEPRFTALSRYATMLIGNDICGEYTYDPTHELTEFRKRGAEKYRRYDKNGCVMKYNDQTRDLRTQWMHYFFTNLPIQDHISTPDGRNVPHLSVSGLEQAIVLAQRLRNTGRSIAAAVGTKALSAIADSFTSIYRTPDLSDTTIKPLLLLASLPFETDVPAPVLMRRRCSSYLRNTGTLIAQLDETCDGTDADYLNALRQRYAPQEEPAVTDPSSNIDNTDVSTAPVVAVQPAKTAPEEAEQPEKPSRRGDPAEAKKLADRFNNLYTKIPTEYTKELSIQIAVDIITRFNGKLQQKEGFTRAENWRVVNEITNLEMAVKQLERQVK